jgi:predicted flavoprotein YhiN
MSRNEFSVWLSDMPTGTVDSDDVAPFLVDGTMTKITAGQLAAVAAGGGDLQKTVSTDTYTLLLADAGSYIRCTHASGCSVTVPPATDVAFEETARIELVGTLGQVTLVEGDGVTVNATPSLVTREAGSGVLLVYTSTADVWDAHGDLAAA